MRVLIVFIILLMCACGEKDYMHSEAGEDTKKKRGHADYIIEKADGTSEVVVGCKMFIRQWGELIIYDCNWKKLKVIAKGEWKSCRRVEFGKEEK